MAKTTTNQKVPTLDLTGLPAPTATRTRLVLTNRLRGHAGNGAWLAPGLDPELDDLRQEHHRLIRSVNDAGDVVRSLNAQWEDEDTEHDEALQEAHRMGLDAPADDRSPAPDREAERDRALEAVWAGLHVLAEHVDHVVAHIRADEDRLLGKLRSQLSDAADQRARASDLLAGAKAAEWEVHRMGTWVQGAADDDGAFSQQPAPVVEDAPPTGWAIPENSLVRHWAKAKPWSGSGSSKPPPRRSREQVEPVEPDDGDGDGLILPLSDRSAA